MSAILHLPLDFEQLPEFWQLKALLDEANQEACRARTSTASPAPPAAACAATTLTPKQIEAATCWVFVRLFVALGYQARSTNRPGFLTKAGAAQFRSNLEPFFGDDCNVIELLERAGLLKYGADVNGVSGANEGWFCEMFAAWNPHLAGNFKPSHLTGNVNSRVSAAYKNIVHAASKQSMLPMPGVFLRHDGQKMEGAELEHCIVLIRAIDRALDSEANPTARAHENNFSLTPGIMRSASQALSKHRLPDLMPFYYWLANHNTHPRLPKTSDEVLADFEKYFGMMGKI